MKIHFFRDSGSAYDASQCRDDIHDGDILVVVPEQVVGFLYKAWPVALTAEHGEFHVPNEYLPGTADSWLQAQRMAKKRGWALALTEE